MHFTLDREQKAFLKHSTFQGNEIVANTRRLCLMNLFLHNIGEIDGGASVSPNDSLVADDGERYDYVLANPPFGRKSSLSFTNEEGEQETDDLTYNRQDFWATTSNKQLNFVQHIRTMLKTTGRAAVVVSDNVLFEGGAGETIRRKLLDTTDLHTILRLPTGVFYAQGVKASVIFFDNREASPDPWTKRVWYYDYRTNIHHTLKKKPMRFEDLADFIRCYNPQNRHERTATWDEKTAPECRWRSYAYEEIFARQGQPRHLLAQGQEPDRPRRPARARRPGRRDHREPRSRPGEIPQSSGGLDRLRPSRARRLFHLAT